PKRGTAILVYRRSAVQGGSARQIIGAVVMIAVAYFTMGTGTTWGASLASAWGGSAAVYNVGIMMLTTLAVTALTKPPTPGGASGTEGAWRELTGTSNQINPWGVIPFIIGESRFHPPHAVLPYTESVGYNSYQVCMFDLGYGDLDVPIEEIKIGDTLLSSFSGVQVEVTKTPTLYTQDVSTTVVGAVINYDNQGVRFTRTVTNAKRIAVEMVSDNGLFGTGTNGKSWPICIAWRIRYRKVGETEWLTPTAPRLGCLKTVKPAEADDVPGANFWAYEQRKRPFAMGANWEV